MDVITAYRFNTFFACLSVCLFAFVCLFFVVCFFFVCLFVCFLLFFFFLGGGGAMILLWLFQDQFVQGHCTNGFPAFYVSMGEIIKSNIMLDFAFQDETVGPSRSIILSNMQSILSVKAYSFQLQNSWFLTAKAPRSRPRILLNNPRHVPCLFFCGPRSLSWHLQLFLVSAINQ